MIVTPTVKMFTTAIIFLSCAGILGVIGSCQKDGKPMCCKRRDMSCESYGRRIDRRYGKCFCDESCGGSMDCCYDYTSVCEASDCVVSEWSHWSGCSVYCGVGYSERRRNIIRYPENGGAKCPTLVQKRGCYGSYCEPNQLMTDGVAMILPMEYAKAREIGNKIGPYRPKTIHPSHCIMVRLTHVHRKCVSKRSVPWTQTLEKGMRICIECQHTAMMDEMEHCLGEGKKGKKSMWSALGTRGCRGSWKQVSMTKKCTCETGNDFIFV